MSKKIVTIIIIIVVLVIVGIVYSASTQKANDPESITQNGEDIDGLQEYTDEGLGFSLKYPADWTLSTDENSTIQKPRQEQVVLRKGGARILIDPLGRRGADSGPYPFESEDLIINKVQWNHSWTYSETTNFYDYHRFTATPGSFILKKDPSTDGIDSTGQFYTRRGDFRIHIFLEQVPNEVERDEIIKIVNGILTSLTIF